MDILNVIAKIAHHIRSQVTTKNNAFQLRVLKINTLIRTEFANHVQAIQETSNHQPRLLVSQELVDSTNILTLTLIAKSVLLTNAPTVI